MYICPHCGEAVEQGYEVCPACGGEFYQQPYDDQAEGFSEGPSQHTSIVALDPEFQKGTRIVSNPMIEGSSRKRARERDKSATTRDEREDMDEISKLVYNFKYAYNRLNFLEKGSLWISTVFILLSFAPWIRNTSTLIVTSGFEHMGLWVALTGLGGGITLLLKAGLRLGLWASLLHLFLLFISSSIVMYLKLRGLPEGFEFMFPFFISMICAPATFLLAFSGAVKRMIV
ncbi:MAG: hypothetical protein JXR95_06400 [Deltaproteobacteria bacterium]|nr:hypothetical protein [Deltaproteobacteria bacterium]